MKTAIVIVCLVLCAMSMAEKRNILDDVKAEAGKLAKCEGTLQQAACEKCCAETSWFHSSEGTLCKQACAILP